MGQCLGKDNDKKVVPQPDPEVSKKTVSTNGVEDKYDIGPEMGKGGFSVVKEGTNKVTKEKVALKFVEKSQLTSSDSVLLDREIESLKKVVHPNILKLVEVFNEESDQYMVLAMELVSGGELFYKIVEGGNYTEKDAVLIMRQVIDGVAHLHAEGICHRDLKPENLLCTSTPEEIKGKKYEPYRIVIADFGLSKSFEGDALVTSCGTPEYVAPEVITADGEYTVAVDMWSVGVITYVLLCGFSPFGASGDASVLFDKIIKAEFEFPDPEWTNISPQAKDFISKLLVKDPQDRYSAEQCKQHEWLSGTFGSDAPLAGGDIARRITQYHLKRKEENKK
eukprot:TRINITY_DN15075_c0_g1_i1.p1 TRINITY_DN15075_c0_g1~~TRINITY_DN15075_c0_g1_i1.p1  ORF type:complete len:336 (-),score=98.64 TRINITY_DN15075_c0_g1_i1:48-1055(-)